jgi:hypothetical protein
MMLCRLVGVTTSTLKTDAVSSYETLVTTASQTISQATFLKLPRPNALIYRPKDPSYKHNSQLTTGILPRTLCYEASYTGNCKQLICFFNYEFEVVR